MRHDFEGIEFYRSTFNLTTGDLVRVTEEPPTPRYAGYSSSADLDDIQDFIRHHIDERNGKRDYEGFRKRWEAKYGPRIWRRRSWSPSPETIDIKINEWCDFGCPYCYMNSKKTTKAEMSVERLTQILKSFNPLPYQIAFGGGEPTAHSDFVNVLKETRALNVVPNFTTAGHLFNDKIINAANDYCGGIAVTYHSFKGIRWFHDTYVNWRNNFRKQLNVHLIADAGVVENLNALREIMGDVGQINLVLLAYYPNVGRAKYDGLMDKETYNVRLPKALNDAIDAGMKISFSEGLIPYFISRPEIKVNTSMCMPQEGRFSCYIDVKGRIGSSSFDSDHMKKYDRAIPDSSFDYQRAWHQLDARNEPRGEPCYDCRFKNRCSNPSIHHYLICSYSNVNGGTSNLLPSWYDSMKMGIDPDEIINENDGREITAVTVNGKLP